MCSSDLVLVLGFWAGNRGIEEVVVYPAGGTFHGLVEVSKHLCRDDSESRHDRAVVVKLFAFELAANNSSRKRNLTCFR